MSKPRALLIYLKIFIYFLYSGVKWRDTLKIQSEIKMKTKKRTKAKEPSLDDLRNATLQYMTEKAK